MKYDTIQHPKTKLWYVVMYEDDDSMRPVGDDGDGFEEKGSAEIAICILYSEILHVMHNSRTSFTFNGMAKEDIANISRGEIEKVLTNG